jgi:hypothetical protein
MKKLSTILFLSLLMAVLAGYPLGFVFATTGTIVPGKYAAWSNYAGWINFACTNCNVQVTDSGLTGYAWSQNYGWISLNCSNTNACSTSDGNWGVKNTTSGVLGGYAWSPNGGWINFSGVKIDPATGTFSGKTTLDAPAFGQINFGCADAGCPVTTTWAHDVCGDGKCTGSETCYTCSADCSCPTGGGGGGGGGGDILILPPAPAQPKPTTCKPGDINCDGFVDEYDLAIMMSQWEETGTNLSADLNKDGAVDEYDLAELMSYWGT